MSLSKFLATIDGNKLTAFDIIAMRHGIPPRRLDEFWKYCFGDDYRKLHPGDLPNRWNNLHADYMIILPHHSIIRSVEKMAAIFMTK